MLLALKGALNVASLEAAYEDHDQARPAMTCVLRAVGAHHQSPVGPLCHAMWGLDQRTGTCGGLLTARYNRMLPGAPGLGAVHGGRARG